jgi:2-polyprenyl-3-methyl-5-hydroxy-6-metoxy-1,4-benzoquinol methylase
MRIESLQHLVCPACRAALAIEAIKTTEQDRVKAGSLVCQMGQHRFAVRNFIPRFFTQDEATSAFGFEWERHARTQLDSVNGMGLSTERFYRQTRWDKNLAGQMILEVGSGAGRFTEVALQTGAQVMAIDASEAVEVNWANNGHSRNLLVCQASLYQLPFPESYFDKVFCFGVLQHTADVAEAFAAIAKYPKPGGELAIDVYNRDYWRNYHTPEYLLRPLTKRIPHSWLYRGTDWLVPRLLPISSWLKNRVPGIGRHLSALIPVSNYDGMLKTDSKKIIEDFSILDTFDTLAPQFISPQSPATVRQWFLRAGYELIGGDRNTVFSMRGRSRIKPLAKIEKTARSAAEPAFRQNA